MASKHNAFSNGEISNCSCPKQCVNCTLNNNASNTGRKELAISCTNQLESWIFHPN